MKQIQNLGKQLTREEQKQVFGGANFNCVTRINQGCGGGTSQYNCNARTLDDCQDAADVICEHSDCCDDTSCNIP